MAENKLCSLIEANSLEFHKVLDYQRMIIDRKRENA
jgi:hypothetical protein